MNWVGSANLSLDSVVSVSATMTLDGSLGWHETFLVNAIFFTLKCNLNAIKIKHLRAGHYKKVNQTDQDSITDISSIMFT